MIKTFENSFDNEPLEVPEDSTTEELPQTEIKFEDITHPSDILKLPHYLRESALQVFKERLVERYQKISTLQSGVLGYIREKHDEGTLTEYDLINHIDKLFDDPLLTEEDRKVVKRLLYHFNERYEVIQHENMLSDDEIIVKYSGERLSTSTLRGKYQIIRNPLSFDFLFENNEDFKSFIERDHKGEERKVSAVGLSYFYDGVPITATSTFSQSTLRHEIQHKEFSTINMDTILSDSKFERGTRNEILSFYIENTPGEDYGFSVVDRTLIAYYSFHKDEGVSNFEYKKIIDDAVNAIKTLESFFSTKDDIVNILRKESIYNWCRVARRISDSYKLKPKINTDEGLTIYEQRNLKKDKDKKFWLEVHDKQKKEFIYSIEKLINDPVVFRRHTNQKGVFYAKVDKKEIVDFLRKKMNSPYSFKIKEKNILLDSEIDSYGDHSFVLSFDEYKINALIQVIDF
jgi:ribosomal protein L9